MPKEILASFAVRRLTILDAAGEVDAALMPALTDDEIARMYQAMVLARTFDERAVAL